MNLRAPHDRSRARTIVGWVTCALTIASVWMHSVVGWTDLGGQLSASGAPPALRDALQAGWLFGGVFLLTFAILLADSLRRPPSDGARGVRVLAAAFILYGIGAMIAYDGNAFFLVFAVLGAGGWFASAP